MPHNQVSVRRQERKSLHLVEDTKGETVNHNTGRKPDTRKPLQPQSSPCPTFMRLDYYGWREAGSINMVLSLARAWLKRWAKLLEYVGPDPVAKSREVVAASRSKALARIESDRRRTRLISSSLIVSSLQEARVSARHLLGSLNLCARQQAYLIPRDRHEPARIPHSRISTSARACSSQHYHHD